MWKIRDWIYQIVFVVFCSLMVIFYLTIFEREVTKFPSFRDMVVFGDSMSDNGNVHQFTNETWPTSASFYVNFIL